MKFKNLLKSFQYLIWIIILFIFIKQILPQINKNIELEGIKSPQFKNEFNTINGSTVDLNSKNKKIVIFWASWCPPCKVELFRLNTLIKLEKIKSQQVISIAINDQESNIVKASKERNFLFNTIFDKDEILSQKFNINATPTILFLDENQNIEWRSSGISPLLEIRALRFLD